MPCDGAPDFASPVFVAELELPATLPGVEIENVLLKLAEPLLVSFECFDVFADPSGQKLAADRTLEAEEVDAAHQKVLEALTVKLGVKFR